MLHSSSSIARFLFWLNIGPAVLSVVCLLLPNPVIWAMIAAGLYLLYGYWRQMRGESPGFDPRVFWFVSLGVNLIAAAAYIFFLGGELGERSAVVVMIVGCAWTLGTAFLSWRAAQLSVDTTLPAEVLSDKPANLKRAQRLTK
jgi:FtsH-binding integral membrane protein